MTILRIFFSDQENRAKPVTKFSEENLRKFLPKVKGPKIFEVYKVSPSRSVFSSDAHWLKLHTNNSRSHRVRIKLKILIINIEE